jgi:hypothetical protein
VVQRRDPAAPAFGGVGRVTNISVAAAAASTDDEDYLGCGHVIWR